MDGFIYPEIDKLGGDRVWKAIIRRCRLLSHSGTQNKRTFSKFINRPIDYGDF